MGIYVWFCSCTLEDPFLRPERCLDVRGRPTDRPTRSTDRPRLAFSEGGEGKTGIWGGGDSAVTSLCSGEREGLSREAKGAVVAGGQRGDGDGEQDGGVFVSCGLSSGEDRLLYTT